MVKGASYMKSIYVKLCKGAETCQNIYSDCWDREKWGGIKEAPPHCRKDIKKQTHKQVRQRIKNMGRIESEINN